MTFSEWRETPEALKAFLRAAQLEFQAGEFIAEAAFNAGKAAALSEAAANTAALDAADRLNAHRS